MKRVTIIKTIVENLIAASVCALVVATSFALPFETVQAAPTAAGPVEWSAPAEGVGRDAAAADEKNGQLTIDNGQLRNEESETKTGGDPSTRADALAQVASDPDGSEADKIPLETGPEPISPGDAGTQNFTSEDMTETVYTYEEYVEVIPERDDPPAGEIDALIREAAERYGLPWELVSAVCYVESGYDPNAISVTGDYGLMQISYINHGWLGLSDPLDPAANLDAGCRILREKIDASDGDFTRALMRYNRGDAYAMSQWAAGVWSTDYTDRVLGKYYQILREGQ